MTAEPSDDWERFLAETTDPDKRRFFQALHAKYPAFGVRLTENGWVITGLEIARAVGESLPHD